MAIAEARVPAAIPLMAQVMGERNARFAAYAEQGLKDIETHEARKALWGAGRADASGPPDFDAPAAD